MSDRGDRPDFRQVGSDAGASELDLASARDGEMFLRNATVPSHADALRHDRGSDQAELARSCLRRLYRRVRFTEFMTPQFEKRRMVARGPSTRSVELTTGEKVGFTPEALHDMVRQAREGFIAMHVEHLDMLPPVGRWSDGEVMLQEDGEQQVLLYGAVLDRYVASAPFGDPFRPSDAPTDPAPVTIDVSLAVEARNFEPEVWKDAASECPMPVKEVHKWSSLPPIEWIFMVPVAWGAARFAGSFLERLGGAAGDALVNWIKETSRRAREPDRDRYVTLQFDLGGGRQVLGFVPFAGDDDGLVAVSEALDSAGPLAEVAGRLNDGVVKDAYRIAYMFDGSDWRLAWFVTDGGAYSTEYFSDHMPDPERFLGRPLLPEWQTDEPTEPEQD
jgi:hypothetical protein